MLDRRAGAVPGRAPLHLLLVGVLVAVQSAEIGGSFPLLAAPAVWALAPLCIAALAASLGFAAAQSRAGTSWRTFLSERARTAAPVYASAILLAVVAIGPLVTSEGWRAYLADPLSYRYLLNLLGWPHYTLPGVFEFNELPDVVNGAVWVAPFYVAVLAAACCAPDRRLWRFVPAALAGGLALAAVAVEALDVLSAGPRDLSAVALRGDGLSALLGGLVGVAAFHARTRVRLGGRIAAAAAAVLGGMALVGNASWAETAVFRVAVAIPAGYGVLYLSLRRASRSMAAQRIEPWLAGLFLFSFPLQQLVVERAPGRRDPLVDAAIGAGIALGLAALFWWGVGRRLLTARQRSALTVEPGESRSPARAARPTLREVRRGLGGLLVPLLVGAVLLALCLGVMAMLYIAFLPDSGGI